MSPLPSLGAMALSIGLTLHVAALCLSSVPSPVQIYSLRGRAPTHPSASGRVLGGLARYVESGLRRLPHDAPVTTAARGYTSALGLSQLWQMFSNPPLRNSYLVAQYVVVAADGTPVVWHQRLLPAGHGEIRHPGKLFESFQDKALSNALEAHLDAQREAPGDPRATDTRFGRHVLGAVSRWAAWRFSTDGLPPGSRIVRLNLVYGAIPIPAPGVEPTRYLHEQEQALSGIGGRAAVAHAPLLSLSQFRWFEVDQRVID